MKITKLVAVIVTAALMPGLCSCKKNDPAEFYELSDTVSNHNITIMLARDTGTTDNEKNNVFLSESELHEISEGAIAYFSDMLNKYTEKSYEAIAELNGAHKYVLDLPEDLTEYYSAARKYSAISDGVYEPLCGALTALYKNGNPTDEEIASALSHCGEDKIGFDGADAVKNDIDASIDFSYLNFGFALERMREQLENSRVPYGIVTVNGAAVVFGERENAYIINNTVATDKTAYGGSFKLKEGTLYSLGASDTVIDCRTGKASVTGLREICVYSQSSTDAIIVANTIAARGIDAIDRLYSETGVKFEASVVDENGRLVLTPGLTSVENTLFETAPENTETSQNQ